MKLNHEALAPFEPTIKSLYETTFRSEIAAKTISFPSHESYQSSILADHNQGQNQIAKEVIAAYELKQTTRQTIKELRKQISINKEKIADLNEQITILQNRILVMRRLQDAIAFQFFDNKIWIAKRFILHDRAPEPMVDAILENLEAANALNTPENPDFVLVSDLTTFVEVGDLVIKVDRPQGPKWLIVELKTGKVNQELLDLLKEGDSIDPIITAEFDKHKKDQLDRILRQKGRTSKIITLVQNNEGVDNRSGMKLTIEDRPMLWEFYHKQLREIVLQARDNQVHGVIFEKCLHIFASTASDEETAHYFYHMINPGVACALKGESEEAIKKEIYSCRHILSQPNVKDLYLHNLHARWRTPFYLLPIQEVLFDVIFQRMRILIHLDLEKFFELCSLRGLRMELLSKKETNFVRAKMPKVPLYKDRVISLITPSGKTIRLGDGILNRIFYDLVTPYTVIDILESLAERQKK